MQDELRIVFMGTPEFAVASLRHLKETGHQIVGVITAPDKPAGRGKQIVASPVKDYATQAGIHPILQPTNLKEPAFLAELKALRADIQVVVAFRMLPEAVWAMPPRGTVNLHASLLPDYRGAAPINWVIINGEKETGLTTFFIEKEIDTGKIIFTDRVAITPEMDAGMLHDELMEKGALLLGKTLRAIASDQYPSVAQAELMQGKEWHAAPKIFKDDCRINWQEPLEKIHDFIRGLSPYPAAFTLITNGTDTFNLKIFKTRVENHMPASDGVKLSGDGKHHIRIITPNGSLSILELQLAGKRRMSAAEFLRGFKNLEDFWIAD